MRRATTVRAPSRRAQPRPAGAFVLLLMTAAAAAADADPTRAGMEFFEQNIRPLLAERCYKCHSTVEAKSKGGLTLDTRAGWQKGGENGAAVVPGKPDESRLITAVGYGDPELQMPPKKEGGRLSDAQIALLKQWVAMGAPDPRDGVAKRMTGLTPEARAHWAYQPVGQPAVPAVHDAAWARNEVDAFVLARLEANGMRPAKPAEREALLRRVTYDLIGLPPTVDEVRAFLADRSPNAFATVVDRLLASPQYGERWARHWLDSARYSDTKGLMSMGAKYRFEDYRYVSAWTYRDYVVAAFNQDKPWNQFLVEQLAADRLPDITANDPRLAALGFITVGKRFNNEDDIIDERIDTTTKAMLGLTVACARCHDHKFDPIPTADYYSLHGIFASVTESPELPELPGTGDSAQRADYERRLAALVAKDRELLYDTTRSLLLEFQTKAEGYLLLTRERNQSPERYAVGERFALLPENQEITGGISLRPEHPVLGVFARLSRLGREEFIAKAPGVVMAALVDKKAPVNPLVAAALRQRMPRSIEEVAALYGALFARAAALTPGFVQACSTGDAALPVLEPGMAELIEFPYPVPRLAEVATNEQQILFSERWPLQGRSVGIFLYPAVNELRLTHPGSPGWAMVVGDAPNPKDSYVFLRGDRAKRGPVVPRRFLEILSGPERPTYTKGSGRLEMAEAIADAKNPLTARVLVNRVWMHHFGEGFVRTPDDLGAMSEAPSHPELLDWLASRFMAEGWSLKKLHRLILLSATYQQSGEVTPAYVARDPDNRLLWHANLRRLDFEAIRDSLVLLTGKLDPTVGGQPVNITDEPYSYRRSLYGYVDRLALSDLMTQFDVSDPDMTNTRRISTIVPQQALFFLNSPMAVDVARQIVARREVAEAGDDRERVTALYHILFQRDPQPREVAWAQEFIARAGQAPAGAPPRMAVKTPPPPKRDAMVTNKYAVLQNAGAMVERKPLTPWQLYAQALICANEFVYVN
jgi:hypothetical protein